MTRTALGGGKYSEYMEEAGKPDFLKKLDDLEDWLYDEGEDESGSDDDDESSGSGSGSEES